VETKELYDKHYYETHCDKSGVPYDRNQKQWRDFFKNIARRTKETLSPETVFEFGCAKGFLVEAFRDIRIKAYGSDISSYAIGEVREDIKPFCYVDSIFSPPQAGYFFDLVICMEVLEHLAEEEGKKAIANMTRHTDTILFSSTPDDFDEPTYINVQPQAYWTSLFAELGFLPQKYDARFIARHAMLFYRRKKIKVLVLKTDNPSAHIRISRPLQFLEGQGQLETKQFIMHKKLHLDEAELLDWADVVVMQRIRSKKWFKFMKAAQAKNLPVLYDIDDNMLAIPKGHPEGGFWDRLKNRKYIKFLRKADVVTTSTEVLKETFSRWNQNIVVLPNTFVETSLDRGIQNKKKEALPVTIGYAAGSPTHAHDFSVVTDALLKILRTFPGQVRIVFFGFCPPVLDGVEGVSFREAYKDYRTYLYELCHSGIDIGLAPLIDNPFNQGKSNIKYIEYGSAAIAGIYSNITPYACVKQGETGILVSEHSVDAWYNAISTLVKETGVRERMGEDACRDVTENYMLEQHIEKWRMALSSWLWRLNRRPLSASREIHTP